MTDQAMTLARGPAPSEPHPTVRRGCPFSDLKDKLRRVGLRPTRQRVSLGWLLFGKGDRHIPVLIYPNLTAIASYLPAKLRRMPSKASVERQAR